MGTNFGTARKESAVLDLSDSRNYRRVLNMKLNGKKTFLLTGVVVCLLTFVKNYSNIVLLLQPSNRRFDNFGV